ncbi:MAG: thiamine phosphate synthase [Salaquimonas sp.]
MIKAEPTENRCRLILVVPPLDTAADSLREALSGGDVASVILPIGEMESSGFQNHVETLTAIAHEKDIAVLVETDSQAMGRAGADGLFIPAGLEALNDAIARFSPKRLVGYGGIKSRHNAMEAGETKPDFLFFGRLDGDIKPEAHHKNMKLGEWCSEVMQISAIVMGGSAIDSVVDVAESGADFVALSLAIFSHMEGPKDAVQKVNALLDAKAPRFEDN